MPAPVPRSLRNCRFEIPRVLSTAGAYQLGMTRSGIAHALNTGMWQRMARGVLLTAHGEPTRYDWINAGLEIAGPGSALSGWDAVRLLALGAATPPTRRVLVLSRTGDHRLTGGVHVRHTNRPFDIWTVSPEHDDLAFDPVVAPARAIADTALLYRSLAPVRALITSAIQQSRCTADALVAELEAGPRNGSAHLRRSLEDAIGGARSIAEAEAIDVLAKAPVPPFEANVPIIDEDGTLIAVADLLWRELRAIAEIDSREYHFKEADWKATMTRHNLLTASGLAVGHYPPSTIRRDGVVWGLEVARWLRARADELGVVYQPARGPRTQRSCPHPFIINRNPR